MYRIRTADRMGRDLPFIDLHAADGFYPPLGMPIKFKTKRGYEYSGETARTSDNPACADMVFYANEVNRLYREAEVESWQLS